MFGCFDVIADDIKIFGQWRYNTDGIDIVNCQDIYIKNSFIHSFDDTITIKGIDRYYYIDNKNIHAENCVLWCDWGKCCEVGVETTCREYSNISFKNCDIIKTAGKALDIENGDCAEISNITFENINVEYNSCDTEPIYQKNDDMPYGAEHTVYIPELFSIINVLYRNPENCKAWSMPPITEKISLDGISSRNVHGVIVKNIHVYYDEELPLVNSKPNIKGRILSTDDAPKFYDISISDIFVNGERVANNDLDITIVNAEVNIQ